jgi:hypothetical protein
MYYITLTKYFVNIFDRAFELTHKLQLDAPIFNRERNREQLVKISVESMLVLLGGVIFLSLELSFK